MNTWREIEMSDTSALEPLYNYKKLEREEQLEESNLIAREFKSGTIDPSQKEAARYEKLCSMRNRAKHRRR